MEMPARRSNYSLLSQTPDDQFGATAPPPLFDSSSGDGKNNKSKLDRAFDCDSVADHRVAQQGNRIGNLYASIGLQRQSSGSSFAESSLSGEFYAPTLSIVSANEIDAFGYAHDDGLKFGGGVGGGETRTKLPEIAAARNEGSFGKSWAQQTEENYQLQMAFALRLSTEATCADDPNFLDSVPNESTLRSSLSCSAEAMSHRFWAASIEV